MRSYTLADNLTVAADYVFMARGNKMRNSLVQALDPEAVDERGLAKVDKYLRVKGHESIFAVGDIAGTQVSRRVTACSQAR